MDNRSREARMLTYGAAMARTNARCAGQILALREKYQQTLAPEDLNQLMDIVEDLASVAEDFLEQVGDA